MEQNFQTSFIPKRPMVEEKASGARPVGLLTIVSILIFFSVVIATGALYFYKVALGRNLTQMETNLSLAKNRFEPSKILQLQILDKRLRASDEVLSRHVIISPVFKALQAITMKTVSYSKFGYSIDDSGRASIDMSGVAEGYRAVALQADLFSKNKNFLNPVFSNLSLDDKGKVLFDLEFSVDPDFINYKKALEVVSGVGTSSISPQEAGGFPEGEATGI